MKELLNNPYLCKMLPIPFILVEISETLYMEQVEAVKRAG